jgi:hypothetical protein
MVLQPKQTTIAYRCPHCGCGVMSAVGLFALKADMLKLKCECGQSEMTIVYSKDGKVRLTVPCMLCQSPHHYTLNSSLFFGKDLFTLQCPYSDIDLAFMGEINQVKAELAKSELELLDLLEKSGLKDAELFEEYNEDSISDSQILDIVMFVINDLDAEGKIYCKCDACENGRQYDAEIRGEGILVSCRKCAASRLIPADSRLAAYSFLNADALYLE